MYLLVETKQRKILFENTAEMDEYLKLNNLYSEVIEIKEIDKGTYNDILRDTARKIQERPQNGA